MNKENHQSQKIFNEALIDGVNLYDTILAKKEFDEYLIEAIDEAFTSLGAPVKNAVYFQLENSYNIPKDDISNQISKFSDVMHKIFGLGASRLEIMFIKNLHSKIKVNFELTEYKWPLAKWIVAEMSFTECIENARKNYCKQQQKCGELCTIEMVSDNEVV